MWALRAEVVATAALPTTVKTMDGLDVAASRRSMTLEVVMDE